MRFRNRILQNWESPNALSLLLWPLSLIYRGAFYLRGQAYVAGLFKRYSARAPVIVVGNLTVGGTGKTPLVIHIVEQLREAGFSPGVISRGYGSSNKELPYAVHVDSPVSAAGDEPSLIVKRTGVPLVIGSNRGEAIELLLSENSQINVIVSDDGLQHLALKRDIEICLIDETSPQRNTYLLPAGPYREPLSRLNSVDLVVRHVKNVESGVDSNSVENGYRMMLKPSPPINFVHGGELAFDASSPVHALAGIGNPSRFFDTCRKLGFQTLNHSFPDHHQFELNDIQFEDSLPVLMTEKDAVKCRDFASESHWYLPVDAELDDGFIKELVTLLQPLMKN